MLTLRQAAKLTARSRTTVWRRLRRYLLWSSREGHECWTVDARLVRALALSRLHTDDPDVLQARFDTMTVQLARYTERIAVLEARTAVLEKNAPLPGP